VAVVNGFCFGGAFSIVEGCDLAIAAEDATFGLSEVNFKLFPGGSVSKSLANLLRPRDALWYGMTGEPFSGVVAAQIGFINKAVPRAKLQEEARKLGLQLAQKDPWALKATKDGYRHSLDMGWDAAMDYSSAKEMELVLRQGDKFRKEGIGDFLKGEYKPGLESHGASG
jgi:trans-feruloyl-CoA hydratase/vanillin synthase